MNLTKDKPIFILAIAVIGVIVIALIAILLGSFGKKPKNNSVQTNTSSPLPSIASNIIYPPKENPQNLSTDIKKIRQQIIASPISKDGGDLLLYSSDFVKIKYITSPDTFEVTILKDPAGQAKQEAQNWFMQSGLKLQDLCNLPVRFGLGSRELRQSNPDFTSLPDGCTQ